MSRRPSLSIATTNIGPFAHLASMDSLKNSRYKAAQHTSGTYYAAYGGHDSPELDLPSELSVSSIDLVPPSPTAMSYGSYHAPLELASLSPMSPTTFSTTRLAVAPRNDGRPRGASLTTNLVKTPREATIDGGAALVIMLALCLLVCLTVWLAVSIRNQLWDSDVGAVKDGDGGLHLGNFGAPPPPAISDHENVRAREGEIAIESRQPTTQSTNSSPTVVGDAAMQTTLAYRDDNDYEDGGASTTDEAVTEWQSDVEDTDLVIARRRARRKHRMSPSKPRHRRAPAKWDQRHHYIHRHAVQRDDDDANDVLVLTSEVTDTSR
ncbi:uncharacterized protein [Dermacentor albipictus]|uniref:uncharacterized protein n=1 Tax=Dermacentor albipictus TaxID=60249 RepID=UPI0031FCAAF9